MKKRINIVAIVLVSIHFFTAADSNDQPRLVVASQQLQSIKALSQSVSVAEVIQALEQATIVFQTQNAVPVEQIGHLLIGLSSLHLLNLSLDKGPVDIHYVTTEIVDSLLEDPEAFQEHPIATLRSSINTTLTTALQPDKTVERQLLQSHLERLLVTVFSKIIWDPRKATTSYNQVRTFLGHIESLSLNSSAKSYLSSTLCTKFSQYLDMFFDTIKIEEISVVRIQFRQDIPTFERVLGHSASVIKTLLAGSIDQCEVRVRALLSSDSYRPIGEIMAASVSDETSGMIPEEYRDPAEDSSRYAKRRGRRKA